MGDNIGTHASVKGCQPAITQPSSPHHSQRSNQFAWNGMIACHRDAHTLHAATSTAVTDVHTIPPSPTNITRQFSAPIKIRKLHQTHQPQVARTQYTDTKWICNSLTVLKFHFCMCMSNHYTNYVNILIHIHLHMQQS